MTIALDEGQGQRVGSRIRLTGRVLGMELAVEERVIERTPPHRKVWETLGSPKLLVMGHNRMGLNIAPYGRTFQRQPLHQGPARGALEAYVPRLLTSPSS